MNESLRKIVHLLLGVPLAEMRASRSKNRTSILGVHLVSNSPSLSSATGISDCRIVIDVIAVAEDRAG